MAKYGVTHCALSPSSLKNLIDAYDEEQLELFISPLKCVMVAGEAFKKAYSTFGIVASGNLGF